MIPRCRALGLRFMVIFVVTALSKACVAVLHDKRLRAIQKGGDIFLFYITVSIRNGIISMNAVG